MVCHISSKYQIIYSEMIYSAHVYLKLIYDYSDSRKYGFRKKLKDTHFSLLVKL